MAVSHKAAYISHDDFTSSHDASVPRTAIVAAVRDAAARATVAVGLGAIAVIHAVDAVGKWTEARYMFWMYMALIAGALITAVAVLFQRSRVPFARRRRPRRERPRSVRHRPHDRHVQRDRRHRQLDRAARSVLAARRVVRRGDRRRRLPQSRPTEASGVAGYLSRARPRHPA